MNVGAMPDVARLGLAALILTFGACSRVDGGGSIRTALGLPGASATTPAPPLGGDVACGGVGGAFNAALGRGVAATFQRL